MGRSKGASSAGLGRDGHGSFAMEAWELGLLEDLVSTRHAVSWTQRSLSPAQSWFEKVKKSATMSHLGHQLPSVTQS